MTTIKVEPKANDDVQVRKLARALLALLKHLDELEAHSKQEPSK